MVAAQEFRQLLEGVRQGNAEAFSRLVELYGPAIRREVRFRVLEGNVGRLVEESDILQSVMLRLWVGLCAGEFELDSPDALRHLLAAMTRNRIVDIARYWTAECRDVRELRTVNLGAVKDSEDVPSQVLEMTETLTALRTELPERDRRILEARQAGRDWESVAAELGDKLPPDSVRRQHQRVVARLLKRLGWRD